jgi:hypothetical protein
MNKATRNKCTVIRFILTLLLCVGSLVCLLKMFLVADTDIVQYLSFHACSTDKILNASFIQMNEYYNSLKLKNSFTIIFICAVVAVDVITYLLYVWSNFRKKREKKM